MPDRLVPTRVVVEAKRVLAVPDGVDRVTLSAARRLSAGGPVPEAFCAATVRHAPGPIASRWLTGKSQPQVEVKAAVDYSDGIMVALMMPASLAETIAVPDGQPATELHITLGYMGSVDDVDDDSDYLVRLLSAVRDAARDRKPLTGMLSGIGRFIGDKQDVYYLSADIPGLEDFRHALVEALGDADVEVNREHGFTPHVTLMYLSPAAELPPGRFIPRPVEFDEVSVVYGTNQIPVAFGGEQAEGDERLGGGDPLPTTTSESVNREGKAFTESLHPRDGVGMFAPKDKGEVKPGQLPPDWLDRVLAGDPKYVKGSGGGGGKKKGGGKKGGGKAKRDADRKSTAAKRATAKAAKDKAALAEADRRDAFNDKIDAAEAAEEKRHRAAEAAIAGESDPAKKKQMRAAEDARGTAFNDKIDAAEKIEATRRRVMARAKRVAAVEDSGRRAERAQAAAGGKR